jgi:hypothetical protein
MGAALDPVNPTLVLLDFSPVIPIMRTQARTLHFLTILLQSTIIISPRPALPLDMDMRRWLRRTIAPMHPTISGYATNAVLRIATGTIFVPFAIAAQETPTPTPSR